MAFTLPITTASWQSWVQRFLARPASDEPLTMSYTHVVKKLRTPARSPLDIIHARTLGK